MLGFVILEFENVQALYLDNNFLFMSWDSDDPNYLKITSFIDGYYFALVMTETDRSITKINLTNDERFLDIGVGIQ